MHTHVTLEPQSTKIKKSLYIEEFVKKNMSAKNVEITAKEAKSLRSEGNRMFVKKDYVGAEKKYTEAISKIEACGKTAGKGVRVSSSSVQSFSLLLETIGEKISIGRR